MPDQGSSVAEHAVLSTAAHWETCRAWMDGLPGGGLNIAHEAVDRHAKGARADRVAIRCIGRNGQSSEVTYRQLAEATNRFAGGLQQLGIGQGDRVFTLLGRVPALYVAAIGTLKNTSVLCPLFSAFGPEPIRQRLSRGDGRVLVTTPSLYRKKVAPIRGQLPALEIVVLVGDRSDGLPLGGISYDDLLAGAPADFTIPATSPQDMALLHFTSGTTGMPKGAIHVHDAVVAHHETARIALDLRGDDVFWCTADPGWVTGTSYGIIAPLTFGATNVVDEGEFDASRWYQILEDHSVTVWYTAPTALRRLMRAGPDLAKSYDLSKLRRVASVGELLDPETVAWCTEAFGVGVRDTWWQTETGGIMVANYGEEIRPGSMGRPLPGVDAAVLRQGPDGRALVIDGQDVTVLEGSDVEGELALRRGWPSMFRGYLHDDDRYNACFAGEWYLTGDVVRRDRDGWLWFVGRADDVIKSAGHLIGPAEVERVLMEHPAVAEAGVIGVPDPVAGEVVMAFVLLAPEQSASDPLMLELLGYARQRLGPAVAPRSIRFTDELPHTRSGKILRRLLKAREVGESEGDLSTLEPS